MKYHLIAITLSLFSFTALADTQPTNQDHAQKQIQGQSSKSDSSVGDVRVGGVSSTIISEPRVSTAAGGAEVGDVLATGTIGDVTGGSSGGGSAVAHGGAGGNANQSQKQAIKDSANNSFQYESSDLTIHRAGIVQSDCNRRSIDAAGGKDNRFLGIAWTTPNRDCEAIKNAEAVDQMFSDKEWSREILCGRESFLKADARKVQPLCHDNVANQTAQNKGTNRELVAGR